MRLEVKINLKAQSGPLRMLTTVDTVVSALPLRLALALAVACLLILGSFKPAASDRRGGDEGSGVGGTGLLDQSGTDWGGSGLRPFLGVATPQGSPLETVSAQLALDGPPSVLTASAMIGPHSPNEIVVLHEPYLPLAKANLEPKPAPTSPLGNSAVVRVLNTEPLSVNTIVHPSDLSSAPRIEGFMKTAMASLAIEYRARPTGNLSILDSIEYSTQDNNSVLALGAKALVGIAVDDPGDLEDHAEPLAWKDIANWLNANAKKEADAAAAKGWKNENSDNLAIAEMTRATGIRRPQLPPLQRARPLQRAAILPPRVRPLGL